MPWPAELDDALSAHARLVAHAAGNLCLIAELQAGGGGDDADLSLRTGLRTLRARAAMVSRAVVARGAKQMTMSWEVLSEAWRLVTAFDLRSQGVDLTVETAMPQAAWRESRPLPFFIFDALAGNLAQSGAKRLWIRAAERENLLIITMGETTDGSGAAVNVVLAAAMRRAAASHGLGVPPPEGGGIFALSVSL